MRREAANRKVVILGGGIGGLSAAHELAELGFSVEIIERQAIGGGKARSLHVVEPFGPSTPPMGGRAFRGPRYRARRPWLPGEHGFRFFPGFYRHIIHTMQRIPFGHKTVADNLVDTTEVHIARYGKKPLFLPARFPRTPADFKTALFALVDWLGGQMEVDAPETLFFAGRLWQFLTSCDERRLDEYEKISWWDFIQADAQSPNYQKVFGNAITRSLVAAKARKASTKTIGDIFVQILFDILDPTVSTADRVLNGPTNAVWIDPWLEHLRSYGVQIHFETEVRALQCRAGRIDSVTVAKAGRERQITGDYFVSALPVERMSRLCTPELLRGDPDLANLRELEKSVEWMNGIQYYLTKDLPVAHGHTIYIDSQWALTSVSQAQFWRDFDLSSYGDGNVRGILSVDISDWDIAGFNGKEADECTPEEIATETWRQLKESLNVGGQQILKDEHLHAWALSPAIVDSDRTRPGIEVNLEPLLVNNVDTWRLRPEATTRIENLFLASDYVRTHTDLATMEAANEAARRAVNGLLAHSGLALPHCDVWPLHEPPPLAPLRAYDRSRFAQGKPWDGTLLELGETALQLLSKLDCLPEAATQPRMRGAPQAESLHDRLRRDLGELTGILNHQARALAVQDDWATDVPSSSKPSTNPVPVPSTEESTKWPVPVVYSPNEHGVTTSTGGARESISTATDVLHRAGRGRIIPL